VPVEADFRRRLNEVSFYLRSLGDVEKRQLGRNKLFYRASPALAASRAASFIMIYNCVEYGTKEALAQIRQEAAVNVTRFEELIEYWQHEVVRHRYGHKLSEGVNFESFLVDMRKSLPIQPVLLKGSRPLPFSGNINHDRLIDLARKIGDKNWKPPKWSLGGSDLELVRQARNDLAHGDETFENVGSQYSIADITDKLKRIRLFMCSYIRMLDRYRTNSRYRI
jgi:hypothetical protein